MQDPSLPPAKRETPVTEPGPGQESPSVEGAQGVRADRGDETMQSPGTGPSTTSFGPESPARTVRDVMVYDRPVVSELPQRMIDRGLIAVGGMGTVRSVFDVVLRRELAMKTLRPSLVDRPTWEASFVEEAQITAQLNHPGVVPIHDLAVDSAGNLYFTMKYIRGRTLCELLDGDSDAVDSRAADEPNSAPQSRRLVELLEVAVKVCDALAFAHSRGVVHRDVKPSNVMVGEFGEVYLMDWGLAKLKPSHSIDIVRGCDRAQPARNAGPVGTPSYMSPEQARGDDSAIDERSDIFSLGAVLYHIVMGHPPYGSDGSQATVLQALECRFTRPGDASDVFVPRPLRTILDRALAREPADRYSTATELKQDLLRFMRGGLHLPRRQFEPGEQIIVEGDTGDAAFLITHGHCDVFKMIGDERRFIRRMSPGTVFGEMAVLTNAPRTASVEAVGHVTVQVLERDVLEQGLGRDTWEGKLVLALVERFRELDARVTDLERERLESERASKERETT